MSARPPGDPAALQAAAEAILAIAGKLQDVDGFIVRALPARAFEGPGRARHDRALRSAAQQVEHSATRLTALAGQLGRAAVELRSKDQRAWDEAEAARIERERRERDADRCTPTPRPR